MLKKTNIQINKPLTRGTLREIYEISYCTKAHSVPCFSHGSFAKSLVSAARLEHLKIFKSFFLFTNKTVAKSLYSYITAWLYLHNYNNVVSFTDSFSLYESNWRDKHIMYILWFEARFYTGILSRSKCYQTNNTEAVR